MTVSCITSTPAPVLPAAALLIHGLGGTEYDLGPVQKTLRQAGLETYTLTLPGHGTRPEDLQQADAEEWLSAITAKYVEIRARHDTVHIIGMCLGALLAVELCKRVRHAKGKLIALAAPVFIDGWAMPWYRGIRKLIYLFPGLAARLRSKEAEPYGIKNERVRSIVRARFKRGDSFHYGWVPVICLREVDRVRELVQRGLENVLCPTLIMHANEDELTTTRSAHFLHAGIKDSRMLLLEDSYHMICVDNDREQVAQAVLEFLNEPAPRPAPRPSSVPCPAFGFIPGIQPC